MIIVLHLHREQRAFEHNIIQKIKKVFEHKAKQNNQNSSSVPKQQANEKMANLIKIII